MQYIVEMYFYLDESNSIVYYIYLARCSYKRYIKHYSIFPRYKATIINVLRRKIEYNKIFFTMRYNNSIDIQYYPHFFLIIAQKCKYRMTEYIQHFN